jgi:hypothetical protein
VVKKVATATAPSAPASRARPCAEVRDEEQHVLKPDRHRGPVSGGEHRERHGRQEAHPDEAAPNGQEGERRQHQQQEHDLVGRDQRLDGEDWVREQGLHDPAVVVFAGGVQLLVEVAEPPTPEVRHDHELDDDEVDDRDDRHRHRRPRVLPGEQQIEAEDDEADRDVLAASEREREEDRE